MEVWVAGLRRGCDLDIKQLCFQPAQPFIEPPHRSIRHCFQPGLPLVEVDQLCSYGRQGPLLCRLLPLQPSDLFLERCQRLPATTSLAISNGLLQSYCLVLSPGNLEHAEFLSATLAVLQCAHVTCLCCKPPGMHGFLSPFFTDKLLPACSRSTC